MELRRGICAVMAMALAVRAAAAQGFKLEHVYELKPGEGVFAYARLTPDGRYLAYASQGKDANGRQLPNLETIVDLTTKKTIFTSNRASMRTGRPMASG